MRCPFCSSAESKVLESRVSRDGAAIRRRRECVSCLERFTTYERIEEFEPVVAKKDGRRERFDRRKVIDGILKACEKRPVSMDQIEGFADGLAKEIQERGEREITSQFVGERIMNALKSWDHVAYVRFASVYKQFNDINEFMEQVTELLKETKKGGET